MKHQGKTVQPGATFLLKDDANTRYTVETVHPNRTLEYTTEGAYLKRRRGSKSRTMPIKVTFGKFVNQVFGEWVESVEEQERSARIIRGEIYALQNEVGGFYDEAVIMDTLFDAKSGKDPEILRTRILDIIDANSANSRQQGYDEGYSEGYDHGYSICLEVGDDD